MEQLYPSNLTADIAPGNTDIPSIRYNRYCSQDQAADNGSGDAILVNNIAGTTISMSGSFQVQLQETQKPHTGVSGTITAPQEQMQNLQF